MTTKKVWESRTGAGLHPDLAAYSVSIEEDAHFFAHDVAGSIAHVLGLRKAGLLTDDETKQLIAALQSILRQHEAGTFHLDADLEDLHMNIEARLTADLADVGRKLHTGRSRNDQVATCIVLYARQHLAALAQACHELSKTLATLAREHAKTPWTAKTHGLPAQPATLGFLLSAHALRLHDLAEKTLHSFDAVGESPLGAGAVAGSTLPIDPAYTAQLMGLRPPRNALLASGSRDAVLESCSIAVQVGLAAASLAQDLLDLFYSGALKLPEGYTTGSSLMPQKRNPDSLELVRGRGKALAGPLAAVSAIVSGLGLGYQRDFQLVKPHLVAALRDAVHTVELLVPLLQDSKFSSVGHASPGLVATDVAEALVRTGMPFRSAYAVVARAYAEVEKGTPFATALENQNLPATALEAALSALTPDPARRDTVGGPSPRRVLATLDELQQEAGALEARIVAAQRAAEKPFALLAQSPDVLVRG